MKAYCINLDRRPDRLAHCHAECGRHGMAFERIAAVDGKDPTIAAAAHTIPPMWTGLRMSAGAYACLQSHRKAWQQLLDSGAPHAMIFEDDLLFAEGIAAYLDDGWVPEDADIVKLETFGTRTHIDRTASTTVAGHRLHRLRSTHIGAGAYVLTAATAQRLLAETENRGDPIDEVIFNDRLSVFPSLAVYQMVPAPAIQGKRPGAGAAAVDDMAGWVKSSLTHRIETDPDGIGAKHETLPSRLWRRVREELLARKRGTVYVVVPHG